MKTLKNPPVEENAIGVALRHLETADAYVVEATELAGGYIRSNCPQFIAGLPHSPSADQQPISLEVARVRFATAVIQCEAALLALMMRPRFNTGLAVEIADSIERLPRRNQVAVDKLIGIRTTLAEAVRVIEADIESGVRADRKQAAQLARTAGGAALRKLREISLA